MLSSILDPRLSFDSATAERSFNREPFALRHQLGGHELFSLPSLVELARRYAGHHEDFFVAGAAPAPGTAFYSVDHGRYTPPEAIERIDSVAQRVLLKRPERYDARFRALLDALYAQIVAMSGRQLETPLRLDGSIFITSAAAITPFHFDPEITFFFQIEGAKIYHLYSPRTVAEDELERFYKHGVLNIGQLALAGRDPARETVYALEPNIGFHQPENTPHWVQTCAGRSISYAISFENASTRRLAHTRALNYYLRRAGLTPKRPGSSPALDRAKAQIMNVALPARKRVAAAVRRATGR